MAKKTVVIKKYENRRLYDTTNSRYVNLDEVAQMLQHGNDVQVLDAATGDDITRLVLTQIIVEDAKTPDSTFPLDLLRQMVVTSGRASQEGAVKYMQAMFDLYKSTYSMMSPPVNPFEFVKNSGEAAPEDGHSAAAKKPSPQRGKPGKEQETEEVVELKGRLAELEKLVSALIPKKPKSGRKRN